MKENLHTTSNTFNANQKLIKNVRGYYINKEVATLVYLKDTLMATRSLDACEWVIYKSTTWLAMGEEYCRNPSIGSRPRQGGCKCAGL